MKFQSMYLLGDGAIDPKRFFEVEVLPGKHIARARESRLYADVEGTYLGVDDRFSIEGVSYQRYPINQQSRVIPGGPFGGMGTVVDTEYLIVADVPFVVQSKGMGTDDDYGTDDATLVDLPPRNSVLVTEQTKLSDLHCTFYPRGQLVNP